MDSLPLSYQGSQGIGEGNLSSTFVHGWFHGWVHSSSLWLMRGGRRRKMVEIPAVGPWVVSRSLFFFFFNLFSHIGSRLRHMGPSLIGWNLLLHCMYSLPVTWAARGLLVPRAEIDCTSPALQGRVLTTGPPGKSSPLTFLRLSFPISRCSSRDTPSYLGDLPPGTHEGTTFAQ